MNNGDKEGPERQAVRGHARQKTGVLARDQDPKAEGDDQNAGTHAQGALVIDKGAHGREGQQDDKHCQKMPKTERQERLVEGRRALLEQGGRDCKGPTHPGIDPVIKPAQDNSQPEARSGGQHLGHRGEFRGFRAAA